VEDREARLLDSRLEGLTDDEKLNYVGKIMGGCEQSAAVRILILRARGQHGLEEILVRDGTEALWPFNFILEPDPPHPRV
jgi:hypothetical protein